MVRTRPVCLILPRIKMRFIPEYGLQIAAGVSGVLVFRIADKPSSSFGIWRDAVLLQNRQELEPKVQRRGVCLILVFIYIWFLFCLYAGVTPERLGSNSRVFAVSACPFIKQCQQDRRCQAQLVFIGFRENNSVVLQNLEQILQLFRGKTTGFSPFFYGKAQFRIDCAVPLFGYALKQKPHRAVPGGAESFPHVDHGCGAAEYAWMLYPAHGVSGFLSRRRSGRRSWRLGRRCLPPARR